MRYRIFQETKTYAKMIWDSNGLLKGLSFLNFAYSYKGSAMRNEIAFIAALSLFFLLKNNAADAEQVEISCRREVEEKLSKFDGTGTKVNNI